MLLLQALYGTPQTIAITGLSTLANGASAQSGAVTSDGKLDQIVHASITAGTGATARSVVRFLLNKSIDGVDYDGVAGEHVLGVIELPVAGAQTRSATFALNSPLPPFWQITAINETGAPLTAATITRRSVGKVTAASVVTPPPATATARVGVYVGNAPSELTEWETWFGAPAGQILAYTGEADWSDYETSVPWATNLWAASNRPVFWSVPLLATGGTLAQAAAGAYNSHYLSAAQSLATFRPGDATIYIRTGWEFNGDWMKWSAIGKANDFIGAFQQFVTTFRSVSSRFRFEWNVNRAAGGMDPTTAYPGDSYVDIIGMDAYYNTQFDSTNPSTAFDGIKNERYGLQWQQDFAAVHNKPTALAEWGIMSDNAGPFIVKMKAWIDSHNMLYHNYWDSYDAGFSGKLSDGHNPATGAAYIATFNV